MLAALSSTAEDVVFNTGIWDQGADTQYE